MHTPWDDAEMRGGVFDTYDLPLEVRQYNAGLRDITESQELTKYFEDLIKKFGFKYFVISAIPPMEDRLRELLVVHNLPEAWVSEYIANEYVKDDPVVRHCVRCHEPFYWTEAAIKETGDGQKILQRAENLGLTNGICFPIHNINGFEAGVSLSGSRDKLPRPEMRYLYLASIMTFNSLRNFRTDHTLRVEPISAREIEVLTWCALGKTSKELAYILFISEHTVNVHIKNAIHKLSANNKTEAVAIAARKGLISI